MRADIAEIHTIFIFTYFLRIFNQIISFPFVLFFHHAPSIYFFFFINIFAKMIFIEALVAIIRICQLRILKALTVNTPPRCLNQMRAVMPKSEKLRIDAFTAFFSAHSLIFQFHNIKNIN